MSLVLTVISYRRQPMAQPLSQRFESPNITVGRSPDNDWTLPDPDQLISKKPCAIRLQNGRYAVTDTSTNGVFVNDSPQPLGNGQSTPLTDGDKLLLGHYEILVRLEGAQPAYAAAPTYAAAPPPAQAPLPVGSADDPFGLDGFDFAQGSSPAPFGAEPAGAGGFPASGNPFAAAPGEMSGFAAPPAGAPVIPESPDWLLDPNPPAGDLAANQYAQPDHTAAERVHYQPPAVAARSIPTNWDPLADAAEPLIPPLQPPMPMPAPPQAMPPVAVEKVPGPGLTPPAGWPAVPAAPIDAGFRSAAALPDIGGFAIPAAGAIPRAPLPPEPAIVPAAAMRPAAPARPSAGAVATGGKCPAGAAHLLRRAVIPLGALCDPEPN